MGVNVSITGKPLDPNAVAIPCGLIAHDFFTGNYMNLFFTEGRRVCTWNPRWK